MKFIVSFKKDSKMMGEYRPPITVEYCYMNWVSFGDTQFMTFTDQVSKLVHYVPVRDIEHIVQTQS